MRIAVLITSYNRCRKTLECLSALFDSKLSEGVSLHVVLVDDGSTDDTVESVIKAFPQVEIINGDGNLFWNRGMHLAFARALEVGFDHYLWLNDDTVLYTDAIKRLLITSNDLFSKLNCACIVVGSTEDDDGQLSYGGSIAINRLRRFQYRKVWSLDHSVECEVMNGNCVLIPHEVTALVGNIDASFEHAMGDIDYALRARAVGVPVYVAPGIIGKCSNNLLTNTFYDVKLSFSKRWMHITSRKGLPPASWYLFTRRHGGVLWPLYFAWPYLKVLLKRS